ncbi:MAG: TraB/GumN family protein [Pseudomonadales bacterium]
MFIRRHHLLTVLVLLVGGCAANTATKISEGPALWSFSDEDTTVYLFGTVHLLKPDTTWRMPHITAAWEAADTVYFEADTESPEIQAQLGELIQRTGLYTDGRTLLSVLSEQQQQTLQLAAEKLGLPLQAVLPLKPWMAGLQLSVMQMVQAGYDPQSGVEMVLGKDPSAAGKQRRYLETAQEQVLLLGGLPEADQIEMLEAGARAIVEDPGVLDRLVTAWTTGDVDEIAAQLGSVEAFGTKVVYDILLTRRNRRWLAPIEALLEEPGIKFVAVGAGHLAGEDSVISLLEQAGHEVLRR